MSGSHYLNEPYYDPRYLPGTDVLREYNKDDDFKIPQLMIAVYFATFGLTDLQIHYIINRKTDKMFPESLIRSHLQAVTDTQGFLFSKTSVRNDQIERGLYVRDKWDPSHGFMNMIEWAQWEEEMLQVRFPSKYSWHSLMIIHWQAVPRPQPDRAPLDLEALRARHTRQGNEFTQAFEYGEAHYWPVDDQPFNARV